MYHQMANQKLLCLHTEHNEHQGHYCFQKDAYDIAVKKLSYTTFVMWSYLARLEDTEGRYSWALSRIALRNATGIATSSYHRCVKELIEEKYLIQNEDGYHQYDFYLYPYTKETV